MRAADARASRRRRGRPRRSGSRRRRARSSRAAGTSAAWAATREAEARAAEAERRARELASLVCGEQRRLTAAELAALREGGPSGPAVLAVGAEGARRGARVRATAPGSPRRSASSPQRPCVGATGSEPRADPADTPISVEMPTTDGQHPHRGTGRRARPRREDDRAAVPRARLRRLDGHARPGRARHRPDGRRDRGRPRGLRDRRRRPAGARAARRVRPGSEPGEVVVTVTDSFRLGQRRRYSRAPLVAARDRRRAPGGETWETVTRDISAGGAADGAHRRRRASRPTRSPSCSRSPAAGLRIETRPRSCAAPSATSRCASRRSTRRDVGVAPQITRRLLPLAR